MGLVTLHRRYELECAHLLTGGLPPGHRCARLHGHRYEVTLYVAGPLDPDGVLIEYVELDMVVMPVLRLADHRDLNTMDVRCSTPAAAALAKNPTVERLAAWLGERLSGLVRSARGTAGLSLVRVSVQEDSRSGADWEAREDRK